MTNYFERRGILLRVYIATILNCSDPLFFKLINQLIVTSGAYARTNS